MTSVSALEGRLQKAEADYTQLLDERLPEIDQTAKVRDTSLIDVVYNFYFFYFILCYCQMLTLI